MEGAGKVEGGKLGGGSGKGGRGRQTNRTVSTNHE